MVNLDGDCLLDGPGRCAQRVDLHLCANAQTRKRALATIQAAIERGHSLDAQTVRLLLGEASPADKRRDLRLHAYVWLALGAGFLIFALVGFAHVHGVFAGVSAILSCLGLGLFIASRHDSGSDADSDGSN